MAIIIVSMLHKLQEIMEKDCLSPENITQKMLGNYILISIEMYHEGYYCHSTDLENTDIMQK